ncbi:MAG: rhodanese-like domain-containing protein [Vicinamibacterales bacterium]
MRNHDGGFVNVYAKDVFARRGYFQMARRGLPLPPVSSRTSLGQRALELLTILALMAVVLSGVTLSGQAMRSVPRITIDELKTLMAQRSVVIIDVRAPDEFAQGRIPGAININYTEAISQAARLAGEKRTIVAYCACSNEMTAARAGVDLSARGVPGVKVLKGGWNEWLERGEAVEK